MGLLSSYVSEEHDPLATGLMFQQCWLRRGWGWCDPALAVVYEDMGPYVDLDGCGG